MSLPEEISQKKFTVSVGLVVWVAMISFSLGGLYVKQIDTNESVLTNKEYTKEEIKKVRDFIEQEVGGLRSDWQRRYEDNIDSRLKKLEK